MGNCPQDTINANIPPEIKPALIRGMVILKKVLSLLAPSVLAASSREVSKLKRVELIVRNT